MNLATILVLALVLAALVAALYFILKGKVASCSYGCDACSLRRICSKRQN